MLLTRQPVYEEGIVQNVKVIVEGAQLETLQMDDKLKLGVKKISP